MAQGYPNIFTTSEKCYPQISPSDPELPYPSYFVANDMSQGFAQPQNYQCENGCQYINQQPPYYPMQNNAQFHTPLQHNPVSQPNPRLALIQRQKNRIVQPPSAECPYKRMRVEEQPTTIHNTQMYQTNTEAIPQVIYQQRPFIQQAHLPVDTPYPLPGKISPETQSNSHSSPSRSPILSINSVSPNNTMRGSQEKLKYPQMRVPLDTHAYYRTTASIPMPPSQAANQPDSTGSDTSPAIPVSTVGAEILETILIPDEGEDDHNNEPELVIVSVKSPAVPRQEPANSPTQLSPQTLFDTPDISYESLLPEVVQPQLSVQNTQRPSVLSISPEPNFYPPPELEYQPQQTPVSYMSQVQTPFYFAAYPPQTDPYPTPFYPRTCMPNAFYTCPQPMMARPPMQNNFPRFRPYEYQIPTIYSAARYHDSPTYEEPAHIQPHPPPHSHRSKKAGMTKAELKRLEVKKYKMADYEEKDESCVICMDEYKEGDRLFVLPCKHEYHRDCVKDWLVKQRNCPLCRKEVHPK